ncbi:amidohydrolase family protein [Terriglobus tenax]|uniref:amidohydrolase family protein n=1 Tax=Terriglobus tenax TaxID=1111115 RepID=UPI0021E090B8|nr:amidohydrolase family protein [Terriglobus tenax]
MRRLLLLLLAAASFSCRIHAQAPAEQGEFTLYKFAAPIGKETYSLASAGGKLTLTSDFLFTDRGTPVPLKAVFTATPTLEPLTLSLDGQSSRLSPLKGEFSLRNGTLTRDGKAMPAPEGTFLIDGYSPVAMQQMLMRYWLSHGKPAKIPTPSGTVHVEPAGELTVQGTVLHGYVLSGLIWGVETLWMDPSQQLVALVSTDAEFDHFEAVRARFAPQVDVFIRQAAKNSLEALAALTAKAKQAAPKDLVVNHVTLIDGTGKPAVRDATVYVREGKIAGISSAAKPLIPVGATVLDGTGKYLIPGLWDMHAHYEQVEWGPIYLAAGVTTVRDCGNEFDYITTVSDTIAAGKGIGPRVLIAGIVDSPGKMTVGAVTASTAEEAIAVVDRYKRAGALQIKIYSSLKPELVPVIAKEAHRLGMTVTGHIPNGMTTEQALEAGFDQVNHIQYPVRDLLHFKSSKDLPSSFDFSTQDARRQIALYRQHNTVFDDTIALYEEIYHSAATPYVQLEPGSARVAPQLREALDAPGQPAGAPGLKLYDAMVATLRELHKDGLTIVAGTDQAIPGYSLHRELEIYVEQAGFTPMEALQAATIVPARVMGLEKTLGTVEVGKQADMVLLEANPLDDIHNTRKIAKTIRGGAVYDPAPLWQAVDFEP